jgi:acyl carrier protein
VLGQQTVERFERVWGPKAQGAWALHSETLDLPLDFFVCFSSVASLVGSPGQSNYAAANAFLDALAHQRRAMGLPGLSINWGPWAQVGQAAQGDILERLASRGMEAIQPGEGVSVFGDLLEQPAAQVGVCAFHWPKFYQAFPGAKSLFYSTIAAGEADSNSATADTNFREQLMAAPAREQEGLLRHYLREELARALRFKSVDQVKPRQRLFDLGLDSLTSVELGTRLKAQLGIPLPSTLLFDFPTVEALGNHLVKQVLAPLAAGGPEALPAAPEALPAEQSHAELNGLSQDEVANLLSRALAGGA